MGCMWLDMIDGKLFTLVGKKDTSDPHFFPTVINSLKADFNN